jgi:hypothetical protein
MGFFSKMMNCACSANAPAAPAPAPKQSWWQRTDEAVQASDDRRAVRQAIRDRARNHYTFEVK